MIFAQKAEVCVRAVAHNHTLFVCVCVCLVVLLSRSRVLLAHFGT